MEDRGCGAGAATGAGTAAVFAWRRAMAWRLVVGWTLLAGALLTAAGARAAYPAFADMSSAAAIEIGERILSWQLPHGGWGKDLPIAEILWTPGRPKSLQAAGGVELGSIDNGATTSEMRYLAAVYHATGDPRFKDGFLRGLDFLLAMQYPTGGWPQVYPARGDYADYVTFNDDAMIRVMELLKEVLDGEPLYAFVGDEVRERVKDALRRGVEYILAAQIVIDGRLTAWCAQHDPWTYEPRPGRSYEHVSLSGAESVGIVRFLLSLSDPDERIRRAILSALLWLEEARLPGSRWARFYEIGTNRPIFSGRDGVIRYDIAEIEAERREGYAWYGEWPLDLLQRAWSQGILRRLYESLPGFETPLITIVRPDAAGAREVRGPLEIEFAVETHRPERVERVMVRAGGDVIYDVAGAAGGASRGSGPAAVVHTLVLDTAELPDGRHTLEIEVMYGAGRTITRRLDIAVRNQWDRSIVLRAPEDHGWFGVIDHLGTSRRSEGWEFLVDRAGPPFGYVYRLGWAGESHEYLVWEAKGLREVELTVLSPAPAAVGLQIEVGLSIPGSDELAWRALEHTPEVVRRSAAGWYELRLTAVVQPAIGEGAAIQAVRILAEPGEGAKRLEIASVRLRGRS